MLPADQTVDVVLLDEEEHEYSVKLRNAAPVVKPQGELKMEAARREGHGKEDQDQAEVKHEAEEGSRENVKEKLEFSTAGEVAA